MLTFPTQLPFFDVSKDLCEFVAINELSSSLNTTSHFHNRYNTSSWHIFPHQVHQIKAKAWQFSPSHTCYSSQVLEARFAFHFEPHKPITTKQWCHVRENCHVTQAHVPRGPFESRFDQTIVKFFACLPTLVLRGKESDYILNNIGSKIIDPPQCNKNRGLLKSIHWELE